MRIGLPVIGGTRWMAGVTYVEMLARSVRCVEPGHGLYLVATPANLADVESHLRLLPLFRGVILLLEPGMDATPFLGGALIVCRDRTELYAKIDFIFPVLNDAWEHCSASWIPDFQHRFLPDFFPAQERADRDAAFSRVGERARMLVLSSASVEADFRRFYPDSRAATRVLSFFAFVEESVFRDDPAAVRSRYGIPERFLLCCNQFWMHKDHGTLFRAAARLRKAGITVPIACTGSPTDYRSAGYFESLRADIAALGIGDQVYILGMIPREDQLQLIRASCALVQPSLFEGWSSIVEDARTLAKPIFLTDIAVHKEQAPPDGTFFRAGDPDSLAAVLEARFPALAAGPDAAKEKLARNASGDRMRAFGREFLGIAEEARRLFAGAPAQGGPAPRRAEAGAPAEPKQAGFNLIGYPSSNLGLGAAARNTLALLQERKAPVAVFDLDAGGGRSLHETYFRESCVATADLLPHGINLWHLNPPEIVHLMENSVPRFQWDRFNVCVPFWELPVLPDPWLAPLEAMDLILAPTRFIEGNLAACLPSARVRYFRQPLRMPDPPRLGRETWGIPPGEVVFITSFDCGSDVQRKNPAATVAAFRAAFPGCKGVQLIVKWVNEGLDHASRKAAADLREAIAGQANIRILDQCMPYPEVMALYRAADAFVSLHRAEGLGLGLMECMALGKPVIGTGWSGNMDFMTEANACLVGHKLVPVPTGSLYDRMLGGKPARWAEPDIAEAADWMVKLADDPGLRQRLGARAESDIREYNRVARRGDVFDDIEAMLTIDQAAPAGKKVFDLRSSAPAHSEKPAEAVLSAGPRPANPSVTALVSAYDSERFIRGCLQNLVEQTLFAQGKLEIVVIDSGSPQGEAAVVAEFRDRYPGIVYRRTERETLYAAWNRAVKLARGTYLVNANTDDRHRPDAFETMASLLDRIPEGLVYGDAILTRKENETWASHTGTKAWVCPDYNLRQALVDCPFGCVVMWRRSLHSLVGEFDPALKVAGDYEFFLRASRAKGARHIRELLCLYYQSDANLSFRNQVDVDREVNGFMRAHRRETPLEEIYPFLSKESGPVGRACAALDFGAALIHSSGRKAPEEAEHWFQEAKALLGPVPEVLYNLSVAYFDMGRKDDARNCLMELVRRDPEISARQNRRSQENPEGRHLMVRPFPGLETMPKLLHYPDLHIPLDRYGAEIDPEPSREGRSAGAGVNIVGFLSAKIGLGQAARNTMDMLVGKGWQVSVYDLDAGMGRSMQETYFRERCVASGDQLPHALNLWLLNPPEIVHTIRHSQKKLQLDGRMNVCVPLWELPVFPDSWAPTLRAMDLVLAPTRFIEKNLRSFIPDAKVRHFPQALRLPEIPDLGREAFGIPAQDFVFATSFDFGSDILSMNPMGSVAAFLRKFRDDRRVRLVLHWVNHDLDGTTRSASRKLREEVAAFPHIQIIDRTLPYPEVLALYRAADAYISLHRAEGLGLGLMESMSLGKPVIGTAWSGNMDFMTEANSCLVGCRMIDVTQGCFHDKMLSGKRAQWADPDLEEAGAFMARLAGNPEWGRALGARAQADILDFNHHARRGYVFDEIESQRRQEAESLGVTVAGADPEPEVAGSGYGVREMPLPVARIPETPSVAVPPADTGPVHPVRTPPDAGRPAIHAEERPLERSMEPKAGALRPQLTPDGQHPLHLHRLASLGLLTPAKSSRGASKITAIVSTYNAGLFIRGCLQNLVDQTLFAQGRLEIVVVDSGSLQGEGAVIAEFKSRHPAMVHIRTERETLYAAWNRAVQASTGDYLVNANTDDRHRPDAFEKLAAALDASYAGLAYGDALLTSGENETWASNNATHLWSLPDFNVRQALTDCPFGCVVMWRRSLHAESGYFDPTFRIAGDYEFFLKASLLRGAIHLKEPLALYYESRKNLSYGNQDLVNREVDRFLRPARLETPMEAIYPFLRVDQSKVARLAAAMDFSAILLHPLARGGPLEALQRLVAVMNDVGLIPELVNNLAMTLLVLGQKEEAKSLMGKVLAMHPGSATQLAVGTPEGDWIPTRMIRIDHDGLRAIPDPIFSAHTRTPLPGKENAAWSEDQWAVT